MWLSLCLHAGSALLGMRFQSTGREPSACLPAFTGLVANLTGRRSCAVAKYPVHYEYEPVVMLLLSPSAPPFHATLNPSRSSAGWW